MGYPARLLSDDEVIESEFRPHWSGIIREGLVVLGGIVVAVLLAIIGVEEWVYAVLVVLVLAVVARGLIKWFNTMHVITNERLIHRAGFIAKHGTELPLEVIQNVAFNQTIFERVFGTGDLMIESAGTHGQTRYRDIPNPEAVQSLIYRMRELRMEEMERGGRPRERGDGPAGDEETGAYPEPPGSSGQSVAEQLEIISALHDRGKLTDDEFQAQKAKILGGDA